MLQLFNLKKERIALLNKCQNLNIESTLSNLDKVLSFVYPAEYSDTIKEEHYIRTQTDEYVIKEIEEDFNTVNVKAMLNVEGLTGKEWETFTNAQPETVEATLNLCLVGTGWSLKMVDSITKKRLIAKAVCSSWEILQDIKKTFRVEFKFDTINKVIEVHDKIGTDRGTYFIEGLNLKKIDVQRHSHDYCTKLVALGKGDIKAEVTNNTYSPKILTKIWKDERYTVQADLQADAQAKLDELAVPYKAYKIDIVDLYKLNANALFQFDLGDIVTIIAKDSSVKEKQRIIKIVEYPLEPDKNSIEIANTMLSFADIQKEFQDTTNTLNNITDGSGSISENAIKQTVNTLVASKIDVDHLNAISARFGELEASVAHIQDLDAVRAVIQDLTALKAEIGDLTATNAKITNLESTTAQINTLLAKFASLESTHALHLTAENTVIDNGIIKNAMIQNLDAGKINSGFINTNNVQIKSNNGHMLIDGTTIQISDVNRPRVQIGEDSQHDYNIYIWDKQGNLMFDGKDGLHADAIKTGLIRNDMVADNANISASKLNIPNLWDTLNGDGTHTLHSSKIEYDGRTLDVGINDLTSKVDNLQVGGRNLLQSSFIEAGNLSVADGRELNTGYDGYYRTKFIDVEKSETYTIRINKPSSVGEIEKILEYTITDTLVKSTDIHSMSNTITLSATTAKIRYVFDKFPNNLDVTKFANDYEIKIEKGNKPTDWSHAPEDINDSMKALQTYLHIEQGRIDQLIKDTTIDKSDGTTTTLKDSYNQTLSTVNSISSTIADHTTKIDTATGKITSVETKANTIERNLDGITTRVTSTETEITGAKQDITNTNIKIDNLQIGGRNLIRGTKDFLINKGNDKGLTYGGQATLTHTVDTDGFGVATLSATGNTNEHWSSIVSNELGIKGRGEYTVSFMFKVEDVSKWDNKLVASLNCYIGTTRHNFDMTSHLTVENNKWYYFTHTVGVDVDNIERSNIGFYLPKNGVISFKQCKLEKGNKATDWSPAPEDTDSTFESITTRIHSVEQSVSDESITNKVTGVVNSQMGSYVKESAFTSKVEQLEREIKTELTQTVGSATSGSIINHFSHFYGDINVIPAQALHTQVEIYRHTNPAGNKWSENGFAIKFLTAPLIPVKIQIPCITVDGTWNFDCGTIFTPVILHSINIKVGGHGTVHKVDQPNATINNLKLQEEVKAVAGSNAEYKYIEIEFPDAEANTTYYFSNVMVYSGATKAEAFVMNSLDISNTMDKLITDSSPTGIKNTFEHIVNENGDVKTIETTSFNMNREGLEVKNGGFKLTDNTGKNVLLFNQNAEIIVYSKDDNSSAIFFESILNPNTNKNECSIGMVKRANQNKEVLAISVPDDKSSYLTIGARIGDTNTMHDYVIVNNEQHWWNYNFNNQIRGTTQFNTALDIKNVLDMNDNSIVFDGKNFIHGESDTLFFISDDQIEFRIRNNGDFNNQTRKVMINNNGITLSGEVIAPSNLTVGGSLYAHAIEVANLNTTGDKHAVVETKDYGWRAINAYETAEVFFGDVGDATIGPDGVVEVFIEPIFAQTVNLDIKYHVFTQAYCGSIYKIERLKDKFIVHGEPNTEFSWELKAKRLNYENKRLEVYDKQ